MNQNNTITKVLTFNTCVVPNKTNPVFITKEPVNAFEYAVKSFQGVNSFYNIDKRNNRFNFIEQESPETLRSITLPKSNYTSTTIIPALQSALNSQGTGTYTMTNDPITNRFTITSTKAFMIVNIGSNIYTELGFGDFDSNYSTSHTAKSSFNFSGVSTVNINSFSVGGSKNNVIVGKNLSVIASIGISAPYLGTINYTNHNILFVSAQIDSVSNFEFILLDEKYRVLECDTDWCLEIAFRD